MSATCQPELLEPLAFGALDGVRAGEVEAHAASCPRCRDRLRWLRAERELMARRIASAPPLPEEMWREIEMRAFGDPRVEPRRWGGGNPKRFLATVGAVAAVACVLGMVMHSRHSLPSLARRHHQLPSLPSMPSARAPSTDEHSLIAKVQVNGPVMFRVRTVSADVAVKNGCDGEVVVNGDVDAERLMLRTMGGQVEALFDGGEARDGRVEVQLPTGSSFEMRTASGDLRADGQYGHAVLQSVSGDLFVEHCSDLEADSVSGDVAAPNVSGTACVKTVSGDISVGNCTPTTRINLASTSGDLTWKGSCGRGCDIAAHTASGDVQLGFAKESAFEVSYRSSNGDLHSDLSMEFPDHGDSNTMVGRYRGGGGRVVVETFSGDLGISRR